MTTSGFAPGDMVGPNSSRRLVMVFERPDLLSGAHVVSDLADAEGPSARFAGDVVADVPVKPRPWEWYEWSMQDDTRTVIISRRLADHRVGNPCPVCGDFLVVMVTRPGKEDDVTGQRGFGGRSGVCAGHRDDTDHYDLSPGGGKGDAKPRETRGCDVPRHLREGYMEQGRSRGHVVKGRGEHRAALR